MDGGGWGTLISISRHRNRALALTCERVRDGRLELTPKVGDER
jgi:hypothetical protein